MRSAARQGQREVAKTTEEVRHLVLRVNVQKPHGARHHGFVQGMVHLREVRGLEDDVRVEFRVMQRELFGVRGIHRISAFGPLGLQPDGHVPRFGKVRKTRLVGRRHGLQIAEHHRRVAVARHRDFNLRHALLHVERLHKSAQGHKHVGDLLWKNLARRHVLHVARALFMKAHKHAALLLHIAHGKARAVAIVPKRTVDRRQEAFRLEFSDVPQSVFQHLLLEGHLRRGVQMLHGAAAAAPRPDAKVGALGRNAQRRLLVNLRDAANFKLRLVSEALVRHRLLRQRPLHENDLAVAVTDAAALIVEPLDVNRIAG